MPSRETIEDCFEGADYDAPMELNARIFKARSDAKMTQEELANAVRKTRGAVAQWESGEVRPRHKTLVDIAQATGKNLMWLLHGGDEGPGKVGLRVVGEVAAGLWREGNVYFAQETKPVAPHPDYPHYAQRLYRVSGNSINRVAQNGEYLHTVDVKAAELKPEHGDLVIVRRMRHDMAEYTAKQIVYLDGRWILRPDSSDPDWQSDIELESDEGEQIEVTDIVIGKWAPVERRRPITRPSVDPFPL
jgi:transcriptional regulator with XRE-family HTH domain